MISFIDFILFLYFSLRNPPAQGLLMLLKEFLIEPDVPYFKLSLGTYVVFECALKYQPVFYYRVCKSVRVLLQFNSFFWNSFRYLSAVYSFLQFNCWPFHRPNRIYISCVPLIEISKESSLCFFFPVIRIDPFRCLIVYRLRVEFYSTTVFQRLTLACSNTSFFLLCVHVSLYGLKMCVSM